MKKKGVTILAACVAVVSLSLGGLGCGDDIETIRQQVEKETDALYAKTVGIPNPHDASGIGGHAVTVHKEIDEGFSLNQTGPDQITSSVPEGGGGGGAGGHGGGDEGHGGGDEGDGGGH